MAVDHGTVDVGNPILALDATLTSGAQKTQVVNDSGVSVDARDISTTPVNGDVGLITNSIIYGHTTAGGGAYVEVKVTPSGAMNIDGVVAASQAGTWNINNVSGTISLPTGASTSANQTNGSQVSQIVDGTGTGFKAKVDALGRLQTFTAASVNSIPIQLQYLNDVSTPIEADQWQDVVNYTVPATHNLGLVQFQLVSSQGGDDARIIQRTSYGSFNTSTGTFTDGSVQTAPAFSAELYLRVTTLIGNVNDDTVTVTYTNSDGTGGRTAVGVVKKNAIVGTNVQLTLQGTDIGVLDVTNVTHTVTQAGVVAVEGVTAIAYETAGVANVQIESVFGLSAAVVPASSMVVMQYNTSAGGAKIRRITAISTLIPS